MVLSEEQVWWAEGGMGDAWLGQVELAMPGGSICGDVQKEGRWQSLGSEVKSRVGSHE